MQSACLPVDRASQCLRVWQRLGSGWLLGALLWSGSAVASDTAEAMAEIEAFGQTLLLQTPFRSFEQKSSAGPDGMLSRTQLTPRPDDPLYGRHSVEIVTYHQGARQRLSPATVAATIQAQTTPFCTQVPQPLNLPADIDGAALISLCPAQSHLGGDLAAVQMVIFGPRDLYIVIWTELVRSPETATIDDPTWQQRVTKILPQHFCAPAVDNARMINCLSPKRVKASRRLPAGASSQ